MHRFLPYRNTATWWRTGLNKQHVTGKEETTLRIGKRAFFLAAGILLILMITSGVLTRVVPAGTYDRVTENGRQMIVADSYHRVPAFDYPVWRWITAPVEVLFAPGNIVVITILIFLIFVGGAFTILESAGVLRSLLRGIVARFAHRKYLLMMVIIFLFMAIASVLGVYEAMVPLIVFIVPLAHYLGWDSLTGLGMSLLPLAFGFSAAITNPFTIGVAQRIAELPLFSGAWLRVIFFVLVYFCVVLFVTRHAKRVENDPTLSPVYLEDVEVRAQHSAMAVQEGFRQTPHMRRATAWFGGAMVLAFAFIFATSRTPGLSDLAFPLMALLFLAGGVGAGLFAGLRARGVGRAFLRGTASMLPGVVLILMSMSVKYIVDQGGITDTILHGAALRIRDASPIAAAYLIYAVTLFMNFFVGSASAKAFLMMPILVPLADLVGITRQTAVLAFDFGDGFSNMLYPSNALLLIGLSFTTVSFPRWIRWTIGLQAIMFLASLAFIAAAVLMKFGPF